MNEHDVNNNNYINYLNKLGLSSTNNLSISSNNADSLNIKLGNDIITTINNFKDVELKSNRREVISEVINSLPKDSEAEEFMDIVVEFLRRRLETVLKNPDLVYKLNLLEILNKTVMDLSNEVVKLNNEIINLKNIILNLNQQGDINELKDRLKVIEDIYFKDESK